MYLLHMRIFDLKLNACGNTYIQVEKLKAENAELRAKCGDASGVKSKLEEAKKQDQEINGWI